MRPKLLIFDCDGVVRPMRWPDIFGAYKQIAKHFNKREFFNEHCPTVEKFRMWHDHDWHKTAAKLGILENQHGEMAMVYHGYFDKQTEVFSWVHPTMQKLKLSPEERTLAMLSNSSSKSVRTAMKKSEHLFSLFVGAENVERMKPHPEGINKILELTKIDRREALMIGDGRGDILAGKNAGIKTAGVTWGIDSKEILSSLNPDFIFESHEEILLI